MIAFEAPRREHFGLLARWLSEPLVARWWNHETTPEAIERDFGPSVDGRDATRIFLAVLDGRPLRDRLAPCPRAVGPLDSFISRYL